MQLRPYQSAAVEAVYDHLRVHDDNPCVVIPTAGGKTPCLATICRDTVQHWNGRALVLSHVRELVEQTTDKLRKIDPQIPFGVYSAGLNRRDTTHPVICASIQSVYKRACDFDPFDLVLVDECHLIPADGDGMYLQFLRDARVINPNLRVVGFTATPYRLDSGTICGADRLLQSICYEVGIRELIRDGYLCPLITKAGLARADTSQLSIRGGEFVAREAEQLMDQAELVEAAVGEIVEATRNRRACLIFAAGIEHGRHVQRVLQTKHGLECGFVCGETPDAERDLVLARFRGTARADLFGDPTPLRYLCNVRVLTTGFDATNIDTVVLLHPTNSPGLYYQEVGRGFRLHPGKVNCLVLDFGGNVLRHGPVDILAAPTARSQAGTGTAPAKECAACHAVVATGYARCPQCGQEFPPPARSSHERSATGAGILSGQVTDETYDVRDVCYSVHAKKGATEDAPKTMRVTYRIGLSHCQSEFICVEHTGFAREKAEAWWRKRSNEEVPDTAQEAARIANAGGLASAETITVRSVAGEPYDRIIAHSLGPKPEPISENSAGPADWPTDDEVPF